MINHHAYNLHSAIREVADSSGWTPAQKVALYSVQSRIDVRASDFWEQVSDALGELGIEKTSTECSVKWFEVRVNVEILYILYIYSRILEYLYAYISSYIRKKTH